MVQDYARSAGNFSLGFIPPMLPSLVSKPPEGGEWTHEIKYDGYRTQLIVENGQVRAFTRNGNDWSKKYRRICADALAIGLRDGILDGEVILLNAEGKPDFGKLRSAVTTAQEKLVFVAFDLLHIDGHDLRRMPCADRRQILEGLIDDAGTIQFSQEHRNDAAGFLRQVDRMGLEGMVSKQTASLYRSGRTNAWLKIKCFAETELNIVGIERVPGQVTVALMTDDAGQYVGGAAVTLPTRIRERLWARVKASAGPRPKGLPRTVGKKVTEWLEPGIRAKVKHLKGEEMLRHATIRDLGEGE